MRRRRHKAARGVAIAAGGIACGCQVILGMDGHTAHPLGGDDAGRVAVDAAVDTTPPCTLPTNGNASLRIGNLVPATGAVDACITRTDGHSPIDGVPVLATSGGGCAPLEYKDVSARFSVPAGAYQVALVPAGGGCSSPLATTSTTIAAGATRAVYLLGDAPSKAQLLSLAEASPTLNATALRVANAALGLGALDFGLASAQRLPATFSSGVDFPGVAFAETSAPGSTASQFGPVDANGYASEELDGVVLPIGAGPAGRGTLSVLASPVLTSGHSVTGFAIGRLGDISFPPELYFCDESESSGEYARCGGGAVDVTMDVLDAYLWGPFAPAEPQRESAAPAILAQLNADVVCVADAYASAAAIAAGVAASFPTVITFPSDDEDTPPSDAGTQDGSVPPPYTSAPCAGVTSALESFLDCAAANCSTQPGDASATVVQEPGTCLSTQCYTQGSGLVLPAYAQACWNCALEELQSNTTFAEARTQCETNPNQRYAWNGQSGLVLFSRFPLAQGAQPQQWVLPSTDWRATIVRAPLSIPGGPSFDAYCAYMTLPVSGLTTPYTGLYGAGQTGVAGFEAELAFQAQQLIAWASQQSAGFPALVAGELNAGPGTDGGDVTAFNANVWQALSAAWPLAAPGGVPPGCTLCPGNPLFPSSSDATFTTYAMLANIPITDVRSSNITLTAATIDAGPADDASSLAVPLSPYYAFQSTVRIRP